MPSNNHMNPTQKSGKFPSRSFNGSVLCAALLALSSSAFAQSAAPAAAPGATPDEVVKLSPFTVSTERDYGYRSANSISATRTNTPIKDVAVNIQVFGKELYEDLLINSQVDLERYNASLINGASDTYSDNTIQQAFNNFLFRGFTQNWGLRDGVREYDPVDTQGLARVEIVKGPVAALYGVSYPGGVMNSVNKSVDYSRNFTNVRLTARSEGGYRTAIDSNATGQIAGGKAGLRFNGAFENTKDEREHSEGKVSYYQIAGDWSPTKTTSVNFLVEHSYRGKPNGLNSYAFQRGEKNPASTDPTKPNYDNGASIPLQVLRPNVPYDWNWSNGGNLRSLEVAYYKGAITQQVGDNLSLTAYIQYNKHDQIDGNGWDQNGSSGADSWEVGGAGWETVGTTDTITSGYSYRDWTNTVHAYGATGVYKLDFTGMKNTFTFGGAAWGEKFISHKWASAATIKHPFAPGSAIVIPYGPPSDLHPDVVNGYGHQNNTNDYYFGAWMASFLDDRLKTNVALNKTNVKNITWASGVDANPQSYDVSATSPMVGVVFAVTKSINLFAVRGTSLFPTSTTNSFGLALPPVEGKSIEGGVKFETEDGKLSGTVSYYTIDQTGGNQLDSTAISANTVRYDAFIAAGNTAAALSLSPTGRAGTLGDQVPGGKSNSKGYELDLNYQPTHNWAIQFSYANNSNKNVTAVASNASIIGQSNIGSIKQQYSILTKYTFSDGPVKGLSVGAGFASAGKALQNYTLDVSTGKTVARYNPSTMNLDVFASYRFNAFGRKNTLQLNIKNLTEQGEYTGWKPTGSNKLATERFEVPVSMRWSITYGIDL